MSRSIVVPGQEISRAPAYGGVARHHHKSPYAAIILSGSYTEAGDAGRLRPAAGTVLFHDSFEGHRDQFGDKGAEIANIPLPAKPRFPFAQLADPDEIVRLAERDPVAAASLLVEKAEETAEPLTDWPDLLACELRGAGPVSLGEWASRHGLSPSSVSRGFRLCYGLSPQRYRIEARVGQAARAALLGKLSLADIAAAAGFADQSHMTRVMQAVFGCTPGSFRNVKCVQDGAPWPAK